MADPGIDPAFDRAAPGANRRSQADGIARLHDRIGVTGQQQHRWIAAVRVGERLVGRGVGRTKNGDHVRIMGRQEVGRGGEGHDAGQPVPIHPLRSQECRVQRQHGGIVGAGGMAHQEHGVRVRPQAGGVRERPGRGGGVIVQEGRELDFRIDTIIRHHHHSAPRRE